MSQFLRRVGRSDTVASVALRMNSVLWGSNGAPGTYGGRKEDDGCFGFLVQFKGVQVELLLTVTSTTMEGRRAQEPDLESGRP